MKNYVTLLAIALFSLVAKAQDRGSLLLSLNAGYNFEDKVTVDYGYAQLGGGFQWGGGLEYFVQKTGSVALNYYRVATTMEAYGPAGWVPGNQGGGDVLLNPNNTDGALNFIMAEYTGYFETGNPKLVPYFGGGMGAGIIETPGSGSETGFAWDLKLGVKIKTSSPVSVNLQAYLLSQTEAVGTDYYWGYYGGYYYTDYASLYQFGFGAVINYDFKSNKF
jgi:hypothetical protein